jgi:hypothetical protein
VATGNAASVAAVISPHVKKVVIANPKQVRIIAHAKVKTDKIDAGLEISAVMRRRLSSSGDCAQASRHIARDPP